MNRLLQSREEIEAAGAWLDMNGYTRHECEAKNWDLAQVLPYLGDGNLLDMGCCGSYVLPNARGRWQGQMWGIDLQPARPWVTGCSYLMGTLEEMPFVDEKFATITCLSVLEHAVDVRRFLDEAERLLQPGGQLLVTFDYWEPPPRGLVVAGEAWNVLGREDVQGLLTQARARGFEHEPMDYTPPLAPVLGPGYYSPLPDVSYTFGFVRLVKGER